MIDHLERRDVIEAEGREAATYLHGQLSQSIEDMEVGEARWSFLLEPQGKVEGFFRVTRTGPDSFLLDTEAGHGAGVAESLIRFKLRTAIELTFGERAMLRHRGPTGTASPMQGIRLPLAWPGVSGEDILDPVAPDGRSVVDAVTLADRSEWDRWRIEHGVPAMGTDVEAGSIPNESGVVQHAVSFTKGCYRGQELVERIASRGGQRFVLGVVDVDGDVLSGATVLAGDDEVGALRSTAPDGAGTIAFASVRGSVEPGTELTVDGHRARLREA